MDVQIPDGWTVSVIEREYAHSEGEVWFALHLDRWMAKHRTGPGAHALKEFPTLAEAAAWCDEQAAAFESAVS